MVSVGLGLEEEKVRIILATVVPGVVTSDLSRDWRKKDLAPTGYWLEGARVRESLEVPNLY